MLGVVYGHVDRGLTMTTLTANGSRLRSMTSHFLATKMVEMSLVDMWFQQNDTTWHTARKTAPNKE